MSTTESKVAKNWSLIIGLSIPLLMVLFIAVSIYVPRLFDNTPAPTVNFLYTSAYSHPHRFEVKDNRLEWIKGSTVNEQYDKSYDSPPRIYLHDVSINKSREISLDDAQKILLDSRSTAPDGYKIERNRHRGFFLFDHRDSNYHYLVNGAAAHKLELEYENNYYYGFNFLAWAIE